MFIYSFKRLHENDPMKISINEDQRRNEYFKYDPLQNFQQNSPLYSQLQQQYTTARKNEKQSARRKDQLLKKYESIVFSNEGETGIHSYRRKLLMVDEYPQKIIRTENDMDAGSPSPGQKYSVQSGKPKLTLGSANRIKVDFQQEKQYFFSSKVPSERYLNELKPRILKMSQHKQEQPERSQRQLKHLMHPKQYYGNVTDEGTIFSTIHVEKVNMSDAMEMRVVHAARGSGGRSLEREFNKSKSRKPILGVPVTKLQATERVPTFEMKMNIYFDFLNVINLANEIVVTPTTETYKAIITKANNGMIVRACLRSRWWWTLAEKDEPLEKVHMVWSSWKKPKFVKLLKPGPQLKNKTAPISGYLNGDFLCSPAKVQHIKLGKWRLLRKLMNEKQVIELYDQQQQLKPKGLSNPTGPFVFDQYDKNPLPTINALQQDLPTFIPSSSWRIHNHLERNSVLHSKKHLLQNLREYYGALNQNPFEFIPLTFHVQQGQIDKEFLMFKEAYKRLKNDTESLVKNAGAVWIVKPGENSNRGTGIQVFSKLSDIQSQINQKEYHTNGKRFTYIIQKYIEKPLLFNKRKFDIRCYILVTSVQGRIKAYWYKDGYVRTSSKEYNLSNLENRLIHLTNDAIQKKGEEYGKFEYGNKVSLEDFQRYLEKQNYNAVFFDEIFPKMRTIAIDSVKSVFHKIDPLKRIHSFELFGLDFMLDEEFKPWLIEFNANPCLEISCSVLNRIIPHLIENVWKVAIDPLFPPPLQWPKSKRSCVPENVYTQNKFELIFDEFYEGTTIKQILNLDPETVEEMSEDDICDDD